MGVPVTLEPLLALVLGPLAGALIVDALVGDPPEGSRAERWYPPVLVGRLALSLDARIRREDPRRERRAGLLLWIGTVGLVTSLALLTVSSLGPPTAEAAAALIVGRANRVPLHTALIAATYAILVGGWLKSSFTLSGLLEFCRRPLGRPLEAKREAVAQVVNRPTDDLPEELLNSALIESAVENTTDSVIGPLLAYGLLGLPGAVGYRAVNTLDALLGHRDRRREFVGAASAAIDHAVNLVPDRLTAWLLRGLAGRVRPLPRVVAAPGVVVPRSIVAASSLAGTRLERQGAYVVGPELRLPTEGDVRRVLRSVKYTGIVGALLTAALIGGLVLAGWTYFA